MDRKKVTLYIFTGKLNIITIYYKHSLLAPRLGGVLQPEELTLPLLFTKHNLLAPRLGGLLQPEELPLPPEHHLRQAGGLGHLHLRVPARPRLQPQRHRDQPRMSSTGHQCQVSLSVSIHCVYTTTLIRLGLVELV